MIDRVVKAKRQVRKPGSKIIIGRITKWSEEE